MLTYMDSLPSGTVGEEGPAADPPLLPSNEKAIITVRFEAKRWRLAARPGREALTD